jgi:hypothetical protein
MMGSRRRREQWSTVAVRPVRGELSPGVLELDQKRQAETGNLKSDTEVVVRLREGGPEIQCRLSYHTRNEDLAVFAQADWESAGWPGDGDGLTSIQLRKRTGADIARIFPTVRFLAAIAPLIIAACAIGPGLIWPPPSAGPSASQVAVASQLAAELAATAHLGQPARAEVAALRAELRAAQAGDTVDAAQQHHYDLAYIGYTILVVALSAAVTVPPAREVLGIRRRKKTQASGGPAPE